MAGCSGRVPQLGGHGCLSIKSGSVSVIVTKLRKPYHHEADFTRLGLEARKADIVVVKIGYLAVKAAQPARNRCGRLRLPTTFQRSVIVPWNDASDCSVDPGASARTRAVTNPPLASTKRPVPPVMKQVSVI